MQTHCVRQGQVEFGIIEHEGREFAALDAYSQIRFKHHFGDRNLGDDAWGQTALIDVDRDGDLDFITGKRGGDIVWFEYQTADRWVRHSLGRKSPSDVAGCAYLQAVIDNFSRRILAWKVSETFDPTATAGLLLEASKGLLGEKPTLLTDGGVENFNSAVDELIETGLLKRLLAMTEITYSNSMIESWWRALKHQWLYLNTLDTVSTIKKRVAFYVDEHNTRLPHSAFRGQTPDEMYFKTGNDIPAELEAARISARQSRMENNRSMSCRTCELLTSIAG
jgi:transposase InsO family protein